MQEHAPSANREKDSPALETRLVRKSFGAVQAVRGVSLKLWAGQVLGLVGDNGAGKSTLVKCISGSLLPDDGQVLVDGEPVQIGTPEEARALGIETVHQDLSLIPTQDVATNMFLNRELTKQWPLLGWLGWLDKSRMYSESEQILDRLNIQVPSVKQPIANLSGGQRQAVAVGRAVAWGRHIVLMDEPAAALGVEQSQLVLDLIRRLSENDVAVLLISHNMQEVVEVCDQVIALRHGVKVADVPMSEITSQDLVEYITGASVGEGAEIPDDAAI